MTKQQSSWGQDLGRILGLWGMAMAVAALWVLLDRGVPAWDQAEHLSLSMNHWWAITQSDWLGAGGFRNLWMLSPKYPPVFYLVTAAVHTVLGPGIDQAMVANGLFAWVLMIATYGLGRHLFTAQVGLLAAGLCVLMPRLVQIGLDYQLDYPSTALIIVSFGCLTVWRDAQKIWRQWLWMIAFGLSLGLALMTKQSALLFLLVPLVWVSLTTLWQRRWGRLLQLLVGAIATVAVMTPWLAVNWVFQFSILENTNTRSAALEGDPAINTLDAWIYYWRDLPIAVSWLLILVPLVGLCLWFWGLLPGRKSTLADDGTLAHRGWLLLYFLGAYGLWSAIANKDPRYIAPYLPAVAIFLAWGLACWWRRWPWIPRLTLGVSILVTLFNLFPIGVLPGTWLASTLAPKAQWYPYQGTPYPHVNIIDYVAQTRPYQLSTLGGIQSTPAVNQHNISYYGKLQDYQVYGRQVGNRRSMVTKDLRSLSWFYAQRAAGEPWPPPEVEDAGAELVRQLEQSPEFTRDRTWTLPNQAELYLYRREQFPTTVTALPDTACASNAELPRLSRVQIQAAVTPGQATPVTYEWIGRWRTLQSGVILLTWQPESDPESTAINNPSPWIHDHGIGLGTLRPHPFQANQTILSSAQDINPEGCFQVTERTATLPPASLSARQYRLVGSYLGASQESLQPLSVPETVVSLASTDAATIAPEESSSVELDWVTQLREAGQLLSQGPDLLDEIFDPIGRINMYDPIQNYTVQAEMSLQQRWQANPDYLNYGYSLVLSQILQLKVDAAIASLEKLIEQDADNPYAHAYLGFVNLYALRPRAAQTALQPALAMAPDSPEIRGLSAIAALFQGNLWGAWQQGRMAIALANESN